MHLSERQATRLPGSLFIVSAMQGSQETPGDSFVGWLAANWCLPGIGADNRLDQAPGTAAQLAPSWLGYGMDDGPPDISGWANGGQQQDQSASELAQQADRRGAASPASKPVPRRRSSKAQYEAHRRHRAKKRANVGVHVAQQLRP